MKKLLILFLFVQAFGIHQANAQLSSRHYLPPLKKSGSSAEFAGQAFYLSTPETSAFDVNVYQGTNTTPVATLSISNTSSGKYEPTLGTGGSAAYGTNNTSFVTDAYAGIVLSTAGFRFEAPSGKKFYVNWRASHSAQAASLVSAGEAALGTDFKWGGSPLVSIATGSFSNSAYDINVNSVIGIMATEDNTQVSISGYNPGCTFTNASGRNGITADVINITLNAGQTYVLEARPTGLTSATSPNNDGWLGATISSNKKIALNQGHLLLSFNVGNLDMSMTQMTPTSNIGKEYVFIRGLGGDKPEFPVIIATENNTEVYVNNETTPIATLNDGQWIKIPSSKYSLSGPNAGYQGANMYVRASKNVYAFQTLDAGFNYDSPANGDVFQVAPLNCLLDNGINNIANVIETGKASYNALSTIYLMIMASSAINANDIVIKYGVGATNTLPSTTISNARKTVLGTSDWVTYFVEIPAPQGDISVYAPGPVAVAYLGYSGAVGVAGYFSGFGSIPTIDVQSTGNGCFPNTTLTATPGFTSYKWYKDGVLMPSVTTNSYTPTIAGDYYVEVYNGFCNYPSAIKTVFDCNPEVVVKTTASKKYLLPGETTTFTVSVKLLGGSAAQNLQISNVLPAHLNYTSSTLTKGTFSGSGSNYTWNVGTMTNGEENTLRVVATAQAVTSAYAETYTTNNTQTFGLGTEANVLADDKTEDVIIYPSCSNTLAGTIAGTASYCTTTNATTLSASNAFGDLQWQSSTDNTNFTNISGATTASLLVNNLASTTYYRMKATVDACIAYSSSASITVTQGPTGTLSSATGTDAQSLCQNTAITTISYSTTNASGATFAGLPTGVTGSFANNEVTISGTPGSTGTFSFTVTLAGSCDVTLSGSIIVSNTNNTISLTSAAGTTSQSVCSGSAITSITYSTIGASGASFSGLPTGVTGAWSNNVVTISGTPTLAGSFTYTVTLVGGCGSVSSSGSMIVTQNTVSLTSATGTDSQTLCANSALTNVSYSTTGATGASFSGLPSGITGSWNANSIMISGTPTSTGNASFTITLTGGCGTVTATGSISVTASPTIQISGEGDFCVNKTVLRATSGYNTYAWYKDNVSLAGVSGDAYTPTSGGDYKVAVNNGSCSNTSAVTTIYICGLTPEGKMLSTANAVSLVSNEGGISFGTSVDDLGKNVNTTGLATTIGTVGATTAVISGIISSTNARTSSIGVVYSTDANFGTSSTSTIQSNVVAGTYATTLTGLTSVTTYYAKSFISNKAGTSYGPVVSFTTPAAYVAPIISTTGLVLNLDAAHPDSYSGSGTTWTDVSGKNNSVTLPSVLASSYSATIGGGSFTFNNTNLGTTNTISSTAITDWNINTTKAISVEAWINYTSNGGLQFYFVDGGLNYRFGFDQDGHFYYDLGCHCDRNPTNGYSLSAGSWHHVVFTAGIEAGNGNRVMTRIYIDGSQVHSNDEGMTTLPNVTTPYKIGDDYPDFLLKAKLGLIRVYNKALTTSDISLNFNAQKARFGL